MSSILLIIVGCALITQAEVEPIPSAIDELRARLMKQVDDLWSDVVDPRWVAMANETVGADLELLRAFQVLGDSIPPQGTAPSPPALDSLWAWARAEAELGGLDALYQTFRRFQTQQPKVPATSRRAWIDLAETVLQDATSSVPMALGRLNEIVLHSEEGDLFHQALQETETLACDLQQSPQQMLYNLYNSIALVELKGYTMMQFSWMLLRLYNRGNFTLEAEMMRNTFEERTRQKLEVVQSAMKAASRQMWRCDPRVHIEGETYVQLTKLLQGHVQNEVDMNQENTCRENCQYYSYAQSTGCFNDEMCQVMQRCNGRLLDCQYFDSDMWICKANGDTGRRYEWIEYENGKTLGRRGSCPNRKFKVDSWWRWLFWHCSYCFCLCDEQGPESDRYFNLRPVLADTANNKVVTGLRFAKVNRVIHLQIQEGSLLPQGAINASTLQWRPVDDYRITDADVQNERDYHTLSWEQRAIDLDDLEARAGHVLTGVRFRNVGTHLNPEIMVTPLNFTAGTLIKPQEKSMWLSNDNTDASYVKPRIQLKLTAPDVPTNSHVGSIPDSRNDQFMLFTHSDISTDAAQTTVPFVDAQPVTSDPPTILAGAGIYHKGNLYYGGFIAPKIITYDMSSHLVAQFPSSP